MAKFYARIYETRRYESELEEDSFEAAKAAVSRLLDSGELGEQDPDSTEYEFDLTTETGDMEDDLPDPQLP